MSQPSVYFACSIRGGRGDVERYSQLVAVISKKATVLSEIFADATLTVQGSPGRSTDIYAKDIAWVKQATAVIAEVSTPSLGVGYEIAKAEEWGIPVLALYDNTDDQKLSAMIDGSPYTTVVHYRDMAQACVAIDDFLAKVIK